MASDTVGPIEALAGQAKAWPDDRFEYHGPGGAYVVLRRGTQWVYGPIGTTTPTHAESLHEAKNRARAAAEKTWPNCLDCGHVLPHYGQCYFTIAGERCPCGRVTYTGPSITIVGPRAGAT